MHVNRTEHGFYLLKSIVEGSNIIHDMAWAFIWN
jgi:hypothetical protein